MNWLGIALLFTVAAPFGGVAQTLKAPASIHAEHEEIHADLVALTKVAGPVGAAATTLAAVLHPHFEREEQIALPPLGLLGPLSRGEAPAGMADAATMADTLKAAGFDNVDLRRDLKIPEMRRVLRDFVDKSRDADVAVVDDDWAGLELSGKQPGTPAAAAA